MHISCKCYVFVQILLFESIYMHLHEITVKYIHFFSFGKYMCYMFIFSILKLGMYIHIFLKEQFSLMKEHVQMKDRYPWNITHYHIYTLICMHISIYQCMSYVHTYVFIHKCIYISLRLYIFF